MTKTEWTKTNWKMLCTWTLSVLVAIGIGFGIKMMLGGSSEEQRIAEKREKIAKEEKELRDLEEKYLKNKVGSILPHNPVTGGTEKTENKTTEKKSEVTKTAPPVRVILVRVKADNSDETDDKPGVVDETVFNK